MKWRWCGSNYLSEENDCLAVYLLIYLQPAAWLGSFIGIVLYICHMGKRKGKKESFIKHIHSLCQAWFWEIWIFILNYKGETKTQANCITLFAGTELRVGKVKKDFPTSHWFLQCFQKFFQNLISFPANFQFLQLQCLQDEDERLYLIQRR